MELVCPLLENIFNFLNSRSYFIKCLDRYVASGLTIMNVFSYIRQILGFGTVICLVVQTTDISRETQRVVIIAMELLPGQT